MCVGWPPRSQNLASTYERVSIQRESNKRVVGMKGVEGQVCGVRGGSILSRAMRLAGAPRAAIYTTRGAARKRKEMIIEFPRCARRYFHLKRHPAKTVDSNPPPPELLWCMCMCAAKTSFFSCNWTWAHVYNPT